MGSFLFIFNAAIDIVFFIVIAHVILSWLVAFEVVNTRQPIVNQIGRTLYQLTEPMLRPIRKVLPDMGGIDLSPIVLLFGIWALQIIVNRNLGALAFG